VATPSAVRTQAEFLAAHGMDELVADAAAAWEAGAARGGLDAVRARSRVGEARALADPAGLGAFSVVEWDVGRRRARAARP
jgi:SAM-dependent MidA family methyltransferase